MNRGLPRGAPESPSHLHNEHGTSTARLDEELDNPETWRLFVLAAKQQNYVVLNGS